MATEQDHVWAMLDDMLVFLAKRHVPTPERTYKLDGGWTLAMDDLRGFVDRLIAERDTLRQQLAAAVERAEMAEKALAGHELVRLSLRSRAEAAEVTVAGLREALECIPIDLIAAVTFDDNLPTSIKFSAGSMRMIQRALAATPAQHAARIVSKWLLERADECSGERVDLEPWLREQAAYLAGEGPLTGNCGNPLIVVRDTTKEEARIREEAVEKWIDDHAMTCDCCQHKMIDVTAAQDPTEKTKQHCMVGDPEGDGIACADGLYRDEPLRRERVLREAANLIRQTTPEGIPGHVALGRYEGRMDAIQQIEHMADAAAKEGARKRALGGGA